MEAVLTDRWTKLKWHSEQRRLWESKKRFAVVPSGRRSGKTEIAKRKLVERAIAFCDFPDGRFVAAAPTHTQAKEIYWNDLKRLVPKILVHEIRESDLSIKLITGTRIQVMGLDKPERIEGTPLDGIILDEYANMKPDTWTLHILPALDTIGRQGWAWFIGVPEGRNHYYRLAIQAQKPEEIDWDYFHWKSSEILPASMIEAARSGMDELSFQQEYEGSFLNFSGRAYYSFGRDYHCRDTLQYDKERPIIFAFDFNVSPGVALVLQEQVYEGKRKNVSKNYTAAIGEVWIPKNSTTPEVCRKLIADWKHHEGRVFCYGDATGGAKGSAKVEGSDWDLIRKTLKPEFKDRLKFRVPKGNPREKVRVNAFNSRLQSVDGMLHMLIDPSKCPHLAEDLEGVVFKEGGAGEIDKKDDLMLTHISDAAGYYIVEKFPVISYTGHVIDMVEI